MKMIKDKNETDAGTCPAIDKEPLTISCPQCKQVLFKGTDKERKETAHLLPGLQ
jgi:hypothetical protein